MRHLLSSEMKLQRGSEKMTSYYINLLLFLPLSPSLCFPTYYFPLSPMLFFLYHIWELKPVSASEVMIF